MTKSGQSRLSGKVGLFDPKTVNSYFDGRRVLVTGGTGSFGTHIVRRLLKTKVNEVVVFSRDEKKQDDMREEHNGERRLAFVTGDVRDEASVTSAMEGVDVAYHAAALKQVPNCECHPMEAVRTNIDGAENVRRAAIALGVETVVGLSTDKAVKPVNVMGMSKAIGEKILLNPRNARYRTRFLCVRYGNVLGSRGSVVPLFVDRIRRKRPLPITDPQMTRFLLTLPEAIGLVFQATMTGDSGTLHVRKMPATTIGDLADVISEALTGDPGYPRERVGIRPGEKIHETLVSEEEMKRSIEGEASYVVYPAGRLTRPVLLREVMEYTSDGTTRLSQDELRKLLHAEGWV